MLHFEGEKDVAAAPAEAWGKLSDARFLVQCIPDAEILAQPEPRLAACKVRPRLTFVRGTLDVTVKVVEATADSLVRLALTSKAIGASAEVAVVLRITPRDGGSHVHWSADVVSLGGLLKLVPQGLIRGSAQNVINDVWTQVLAKLSG